MVGGPYRPAPERAHGIERIRVRRPGTHAWSLALAIPLLVAVLTLAVGYTTSSVECDTTRSTCHIVERRLGITTTRDVDNVAFADFGPRSVVLVTEDGEEVDVSRWSLVAPSGHLAMSFVEDMDEARGARVDRMAEADADAVIAGLRTKFRDCYQRPHRLVVHTPMPSLRDDTTRATTVRAELHPPPATLAWMLPLGAVLLIAGLFSLVNGVAAVRGVPLAIDRERRSLLVPALDFGARAQEIAIDRIVGIEARRAARCYVALFALLDDGDMARLTPIGADTAKRLERSRQDLEDRIAAVRATGRVDYDRA